MIAIDPELFCWPLALWSFSKIYTMDFDANACFALRSLVLTSRSLQADAVLLRAWCNPVGLDSCSFMFELYVKECTVKMMGICSAIVQYTYKQLGVQLHSCICTMTTCIVDNVIAFSTRDVNKGL